MRKLALLGLMVAQLIAVGCTVGTSVPSGPQPTTFNRPTLGPEPNVYGPTRRPPCNGPRCPRR
jgi:hypothetical protein